MPRDVLVTGAYGQCGTAIIDHLHDREEYRFTYLNRSDRPADHPYGGHDTVVADVADFDAIRPAFEGQDAVVHLAALPNEGPWPEILESNIIGAYNVFEAARQAGVESIVFGSTNHVVGMYEEEYAPRIYQPEAGIVVDHTDPIRPDSYYGTSKAFGEALGRYYVEAADGAPSRFYALRIGNVSHEEEDYPDSDRLRAIWQSRRDFAHQIDCCLQDDSVTFDVFYGVSDNDGRWFDLEHARATIGYYPQDNGEESGAAVASGRSG
jgi:nucleoside-diphosphate-sugar epimerase